MWLGELISDAACRLVSGDSDRVRVTDITEDSRSTMPGSLFIARSGLQSDGRAFIRQAIEDGASAVLTDAQGIETVQLLNESRRDGGVAAIVAEDVSLAGAQIAERFFGSPSSQLTVIATTGTNGKTSVTHFVHQILNASKVKCGLIGTVAVDDGDRVYSSEMTTPPATEISQTLCSMTEHGCEAAAIEASSHALSQKRLGGIDIDIALFTNLTGDHLDYHGSMDAYADAKAELFDSLTPEGLAVINIASSWADRMARDCPARVLRVGVLNGHETSSQVDASIRVLAPAHTGETCALKRVRLELMNGCVEGDTQLIGEFNLLNLLLACIAAEEAGASLDELASALSTLSAPPGRLERVSVEGIQHAPTVLVDYAHTDDALGHAIAATRELVPVSGRLWVVFGCGGDRDITKRPRMGTVACSADRIVITSDNPRSERPNDIIAAVLSGIPENRRNDTTVHADRADAIRAAIQAADEQDVVLIAGKGHETEQITIENGETIRRAFDDRLFARDALLARHASETSVKIDHDSARTDANARV